MASWMIHLRIADLLLKKIPDLDKEAFIMGNIAPDSGVPNADRTAFIPSKTVSHFRTDNGSCKKSIDTDAFIKRYFTAEQQKRWDIGTYSFYLGYLTHLLTDRLWSDRIAFPAFQKHDAWNNSKMTAAIKADWYDLDFLYLRDHPAFDGFEIYRNIQSFPNVYLDIFSRDAFDARRAFIVRFYQTERQDLDREYQFLSKTEADRFVHDAACAILDEIQQYMVQTVQV